MNTTLRNRLEKLSIELDNQLSSEDVDFEELQRLLSLARIEDQSPVAIQQEARKQGVVSVPANRAFHRPTQF